MSRMSVRFRWLVSGIPAILSASADAAGAASASGSAGTAARFVLSSAITLPSLLYWPRDLYRHGPVMNAIVRFKLRNPFNKYVELTGRVLIERDHIADLEFHQIAQSDFTLTQIH